MSLPLFFCMSTRDGAWSGVCTKFSRRCRLCFSPITKVDILLDIEHILGFNIFYSESASFQLPAFTLDSSQRVFLNDSCDFALYFNVNIYPVRRCRLHMDEPLNKLKSVAELKNVADA